MAALLFTRRVVWVDGWPVLRAGGMVLVWVEYAGVMTYRATLDRQAALPLWAQVLKHLRRRLNGGEFAEQFPTDKLLMDEYGVSRHTVREAIRRIEADGILDRRRGRGTFVSRDFAQRLGSIYSLFRSVEAAGVKQTSVVLVQESRSDPQVALKLDLPDDSEFLFLERLRLAGSDVLAIDRVWLPIDLAKPLLGVDFTKTAVYDELRDRCGLAPESGQETIRSIVPTETESDGLGIDPGKSVFMIERKTFADGSPLEWRVTLVRADRYHFVANWSSRSDSLPEFRFGD